MQLARTALWPPLLYSVTSERLPNSLLTHYPTPQRYTVRTTAVSIKLVINKLTDAGSTLRLTVVTQENYKLDFTAHVLRK